MFCNGSIIHRKFKALAASRWRWVSSRVHIRSSAHALDCGCAYITPLLKVTRPAKQQPYWQTVADGRSAIGYRQVALPNQRAFTDRRPNARGQATPLSFLSHRAHALIANKVFNEQGVFRKRAILIFGGSRRGRVVILITQHPAVQYGPGILTGEQYRKTGAAQTDTMCLA